ncbi:MAG TPA: hypothetical protein VJO53_00220 [Candidatus Acidoferrales bacterium]|nr:hypothetical protein [Candidatus Acidoferrales bacterium]
MNRRAEQRSLRAWPAIIVAFIAMCAAPGGTHAQTDNGADRLTVHLSDPSRPGHVKANLINGGITVNSYDGKDILIEARVRYAPPPRTYGGMHRLSTGNTGLTAEEENNEVLIGVESIFHLADLTIMVPVHTSLSLRTVNSGNISVSGVDGDLDVSVINGGVMLENVSGSTVAHTLNGKLVAKFSRVDPQKAMAFSSLNGDIDVTFPADLKATLSLHSERGDAFSDFDVKPADSPSQPLVDDWGTHGGKYRVRMDRTVHATINGGGPDMHFSTLNGNIFIRKSGGSH